MRRSFLFYLSGWTSTLIPYDALGYELTSDYHERAQLFGVKTAFQFAGYLLQITVGLGVSQAFSTDILRQVQVQAVLYSALLALCFALLLRRVDERARLASPPTWDEQSLDGI